MQKNNCIFVENTTSILEQAMLSPLSLEYTDNNSRTAVNYELKIY